MKWGFHYNEGIPLICTDSIIKWEHIREITLIRIISPITN